MKNVPNLRFKEFSGEWKNQKLGKLTKLTDGVHFTPTYVESGVPFWSVETVVSNVKPKYITQEAHNEAIKRCYPQYGDILLTRIGTLAIPKLVDWNEPFSIYVSLALIKSSSKFNSKFCKYYLETEYYRKDFLSKSLLTATPQKINMEDLKHTKLSLPSQKEQEKIASFFSLIDKKIELQTKKVEELKNYKKGIMQKMFPRNGETVPELRFVGFTEAWEQRKVGDILTERKIKQKISEETPLLAFAAGQGVIERSERKTNNRDFLTKDSTQKTYLLTKYDDIVYNPSNLKYGAIDRNKHGQGVISPIYVTFESTQIPCFIELIVKSESFKQRALKYEEGTVTKRQSVKPEDLLCLSVTLPVSKDEQLKIGEYFHKLDNLITLHQCKLDALNEYKKGLLQQMFI